MQDNGPQYLLALIFSASLISSPVRKILILIYLFPSPTTKVQIPTPASPLDAPGRGPPGAAGRAVRAARAIKQSALRLAHALRRVKVRFCFGWCLPEGTRWGLGHA